MQLISLFNHKGGVGTTTSTFNLGWALAGSGKRVLLVDGDSQCNLTGTILGFNEENDPEKFYKENPFSNLYACLTPAFSATQKPLDPAKIISVKRNSNLYLLPGHIKFSENEAQLSVALTTEKAIPALRNLPGAIYHLLKRTAEKENIDFVLIDMSPNVGSINKCLLMSSNYFIIPTFPDYYCCQAVFSLSEIIPQWNEEVKTFRDNELIYHLPENPPKFLGILSQRYRPHNGSPAASYQEWINKIDLKIKNYLVPALTKEKMVVVDKNKRISSNIADFNTLIVQSQNIMFLSFL